jgi:hypothetical protein
MDGTTEITGHTVWRATVWRATSRATPYLGPNTGPTADAPIGNHTNETRRVRGHPPPKNKTPDGPLPQVVQQLCEHSGKHMSDLPTLPKYCHPTGQSFLCWNWVLGRCFRGPRCRFARGHLKKGESIEAFANGISDVISKEVLHFINLPVGEGGDGSPKNKRKGGGSWRPCGYLTMVGTGCSRMRKGGRAQRSHISCSWWYMWWPTAGAVLGGPEGSGGRKNAMQGCKAHGTMGIIAGR